MGRETNQETKSRDKSREVEETKKEWRERRWQLPCSLPRTPASSFSYHGRDLAKIGASSSYLELVLGSRANGGSVVFWDEAYQLGRFHVRSIRDRKTRRVLRGEREGGQQRVTPSRRVEFGLMGKIKLKGMFELIDLSQPAARPVVILHWIPAVEPGRTQ